MRRIPLLAALSSLGSLGAALIGARGLMSNVEQSQQPETKHEKRRRRRAVAWYSGSRVGRSCYTPVVRTATAGTGGISPKSVARRLAAQS